MSMRAIFVVGSALAMSATLNAQAQKPQPAPRVTKEKPAQLPQPEWVPRDFNRLGFDFFSFGTPLEGKVVKGMPYSAEIATESVQTLGDGNRIVHRSTSRVYRDSEGRVRREDDRPTGRPISPFRIRRQTSHSRSIRPIGLLVKRLALASSWLFRIFEGCRLSSGYTPAEALRWRVS